MLRSVGWGGFFTGWSCEHTTAWAHAADRLGLIYQSIHAPFHGVRRMWEEGDGGRAEAQMLIDCVSDCAAHHIPVMVLHPFIGFDAHTPNAVGIENYARVVDAADRLGVTLGFENLEGEEYLAALMDAFRDSPACGFCLDTGHEMCYNGGRDMLSLYGDRLCHTHFNDNLGVYAPDLTWENDLHLLMGDGIVDWKRVMDRIDATAYEGVLMCELKLTNKPNLHTHDGYAAMHLEAFYELAFERMRAVLDRTLVSAPMKIK
ncbi:MAG: sugar phosphate isomerase/epimerase [Clostridia bacterium]|nr:sugar phosphate isomerase/epimerase [Clostridia bacterium]